LNVTAVFTPRSMPPRVRRSIVVSAVLACTFFAGACATLRQLAALEQVAFSLDGVSRVSLADVELTAIRRFEDLTITDGLKLAEAVGAGTLDLSLGLRVRAHNPESNVDARMVRMDWTLILDGRETVSGRVTDEVLLPRGQDTSVPVSAELDLMSFFEGGAREMFDLALGLTGFGEEPTELTLRIRPVVETVLGPIAYEAPIQISLPTSSR
jgi:hypothetical protein